MEKVDLSSFIYKTGPFDKYYVFNTKSQSNVLSTGFERSDLAIKAKRKFFSEKITITENKDGSLNAFFDGLEIKGLENPCKKSEIESFLNPHGLKIVDNICVFDDEKQ